MSMVVTRFAPSPTGYLHVGGARTALFNWLLARHSGGKFLLRIEDTDLKRSTEEACAQLLDDLKWLGLGWDNAELVYQSRRLPVYNAIIERLIAEGKAYKAYETEAELDALRKKAGHQYRYRRPELSAEQIRSYEAEGRSHVVRLVMPPREYRFDDAILGPGQGYGPGEAQDFVIRKSDGMPTYHFAVVVDDQEMGVTHILRGQEHLLNTCNHIALQDALGYPRPVYAHLPIIMNADRTKMSKRDRDKAIRSRAKVWMNSTRSSLELLGEKAGLGADRVAAWLKSDTVQLDFEEQAAVMPVVGLRAADLPEILVHDFRKNGYLPEVLLNFLALLGWNPGGDKERMSVEEMVQLFSLDRIGKSNASFNREKLLAFNTEAAAAATPQRLLQAFRDYLAANPESPLNRATDVQLSKLLEMKKGFRLLREVDDASRFLLMADDQIAYQGDAVEKVLRKNNAEGLAALRAIRPLLDAVSAWTAHDLETVIKAYGDERQLPLNKLAQPLRVALSGGTVSPPIFQSLEFLGKESTLRRIDRCLASLA